MAIFDTPMMCRMASVNRANSGLSGGGFIGLSYYEQWRKYRMLWAILIAVVVMGSIATKAISEIGEVLAKSLDELHEKVDALQEKIDEIES